MESSTDEHVDKLQTLPHPPYSSIPHIAPTVLVFMPRLYVILCAWVLCSYCTPCTLVLEYSYSHSAWHRARSTESALVAFSPRRRRCGRDLFAENWEEGVSQRSQLKLRAWKRNGINLLIPSFLLFFVLEGTQDKTRRRSLRWL